MCGFRWCGVGVVPLITVMRLSAMWPCTPRFSASPGMRGSKRTWFRASVFDT